MMDSEFEKKKRVTVRLKEFEDHEANTGQWMLTMLH